jgi:hypothetical protein
MAFAGGVRGSSIAPLFRPKRRIKGRSALGDVMR